MAHFSSTRHGAFNILTAVDVGRTVSLRLPGLRPLSTDEAAALAHLLRGQVDVIARLAADALGAGAHLSHGGLLRPEEAAQLRPAQVLTSVGAEAPPAWTEQGRARLLSALAGETDLVRLVGMTTEEATYWIYVNAKLERYVGGMRMAGGPNAIRRLLYGERKYGT